MRPNVAKAVEFYNGRLRTNWNELKLTFTGLDRPPDVSMLLERERLRMNDAEALLFGSMGMKSLHFFSMFVLGQDRMTPPGGAHGEVCRQLQEPFERATFLMAHREFFKSTVGAICRPLWGMVRDPEGYDHVHRVDDMDLGGEQLQVIAGHIEGANAVFNRLYPDIEPKKNEWSAKTDHRLSVSCRPKTQAGPTFELRSTKMGMAGRHVRDMTYDDWVTETNCESRFEQDRLFDAFVKAWPTLDTDNLLICGTPYTRYDCWSQVLKHYYPHELRVLLYPLRGTAYIDDRHEVVWEETVAGGEHEYANPYEWDDERFARRKAQMSPQPWFFDLQYLLATDKDFGGGFAGVEFEYATMEMLAFNDDNPLCFYTASDTASGDADSRPSTAVWAVRSTGELICWDVKYYDEEIDLIDDLFVLWNTLSGVVVSMGVERASEGGISALKEIERQCRVRSQWPPIEELTHGGEAKDGRILGTLRPLYRRKMVYHHPNLRDGEYEREILEFGRYNFKDGADASAYAARLCDKYGYIMTPADTDERKEGVERAAGAGDKVGYTLEQLMDPKRDGWDDVPNEGESSHAPAGHIL